MSERNNKLKLLGSAPIPKALMALGIPIMIGMLINALYNLVDAYFVGGLGESQMGAISVVFPLGQVVVGLGLMFGNGAASYLSRLLGRGDKDTANRVASTALYSSILIGAIIILFSTIFLKPILAMLGATETIMPYAPKRVVKDFLIKFTKMPQKKCQKHFHAPDTQAGGVTFPRQGFFRKRSGIPAAVQGRGSSAALSRPVPEDQRSVRCGRCRSSATHPSTLRKTVSGQAARRYR